MSKSGNFRLVVYFPTISSAFFHNNYFRLRTPLERRLYEIVHKHVDQQVFWGIGIEALRDRYGNTVARLRQFQSELKKIIEADTLPVELGGGALRWRQSDIAMWQGGIC